MKFVHSVSLMLVMAAVVAPAWSAQDDQHQGHHPATAGAAATPTPAPNSIAGKSNPDMARVDMQMKAMREMHSKMMAAKTPEERNALMAEHMKVMREGMDMMNAMSPDGMGGMDMMGGMSQDDMGAMKGDMTACHQMMEKRMEMMQAMMQMMMDLLPASSAN
jgi:hypothetical protein